MFAEPRYVDSENESVPMSRRRERIASKEHWENSGKETMDDSQIYMANSD